MKPFVIRLMDSVPALAILNTKVLERAVDEFISGYSRHHKEDPESWPNALPPQEWVQLFGEFLNDTHIVRIEEVSVPDPRPELRLVLNTPVEHKPVEDDGDNIPF